MKRKRLFALLLAMSGVAAFLMAREFRTASTSIPAFTVHYTEHAKNNVTGRTVFAAGTYARRGDASAVQVDLVQLPSGDMNASRSIISMPEGQRIAMSDSARVKTTVPYPRGSDPLKYASSRPDCGASPTHPVLGYGEYLGVKVVKLMHDTGDRRLETWHAPSLGCYVVWQHMDFLGEDGKVTDYSEWAATSIVVGEPSPELFTVPSDYRETKPSEMEAATRAHFGGSCSECDSAKWKAQDDQYVRVREGSTHLQK